MKRITRQQIKNLFTNPEETMYNGLWLSEYKNEGEHKRWWENGQLLSHCFYKNKRAEGEYKEWNKRGELVSHRLYKKDIIVGYLM